MSVAEEIQTKVARKPRGKPFGAADFLGVGSRAAVAQTLKRMSDRGQILRVRRGLYVRPQKSRYVGAVMPDPHRIVEEIVRRRNESIQIGGAEAARRLGLSTQMPLRPTYLTSGRSRRLMIGNLEVQLRGVSSRKLILAGRPAGDALAALYYLGREGVTPEVLGKLEERLPVGEFEALERATPWMPAWMASVFRAYEGEGRDG